MAESVAGARSMFGKFFKHGPRPIINMMGMYLVFSYSLYSLKVKTLWDTREMEISKLATEVKQINDRLMDERKLKEIEDSVRSGKIRDVAELKKEISKLIQVTDEPVKELDSALWKQSLGSLVADKSSNEGKRIL